MCVEIYASGLPSIAETLLQTTRECVGLLDLTVIDGHTPTAPGYINHPIIPNEPEDWPEAIFLTKNPFLHP